jgi:hypothetical protein
MPYLLELIASIAEGSVDVLIDKLGIIGWSGINGCPVLDNFGMKVALWEFAW